MIPRRWLHLVAVALTLGAVLWMARGDDTAGGLDLRAAFNRRALLSNVPLFWAADTDRDGRPDPEELRALLSDQSNGEDRGHITDSSALAAELQTIARTEPTGPGIDLRRALVAEELEHSFPCLVETDLSELETGERSFAHHILLAGRLIHELYLTQTGAASLRGGLAIADAPSIRLFERNRGPWCVVSRDPHCSALPSTPAHLVDVYPAFLQGTSRDYCEEATSLARDAPAGEAHTAIREVEYELVVLPYHLAYAGLVSSIAAELRSAADGLAADDSEEALRSYLRATARAFETDEWSAADAAFGRARVPPGRWYVRVDHERTAWDPCQRRVTFGLTFGQRNTAAVRYWQTRVAAMRVPLQERIRAVLGRSDVGTAALPAPEVVDVIVNAGSTRLPFGADRGISVGGRVVAMTTSTPRMRMPRNRLVPRPFLPQTQVISTRPTRSKSQPSLCCTKSGIS